MKKLAGMLAALMLWGGVALGMEAKKAEKPCPCPNCPMKGQMMSAEEWQKYHKNMPMPEEMRRRHEEMRKRHQNMMRHEDMGSREEMMPEEGNANSTENQQQEMEENYHQRYHKRWH